MGEEVDLCGDDAESLGDGTHGGVYGLHLVGVPDVGDIARVEHVVNVLEERLVDELRVREEEHGRLVVHASALHDVLEVLVPLELVVSLLDLNTPQLKLVDLRSEACE